MDELLQHGKNPLWEVLFRETPMQTFIEGITVARKYQLQNQETIQPNEADKTSFGCESEKSCVTSQQTADSFFCPIINQLSEQVLTITRY